MVDQSVMSKHGSSYCTSTESKHSSSLSTVFVFVNDSQWPTRSKLMKEMKNESWIVNESELAEAHVHVSDTFTARQLLAHQEPSQHDTVRSIRRELGEAFDYGALRVTAAIHTQSMLVLVAMKLCQTTLEHISQDHKAYIYRVIYHVNLRMCPSLPSNHHHHGFPNYSFVCFHLNSSYLYFSRLCFSLEHTNVLKNQW